MVTKEEIESFHKLLDRKVVFMGDWKETDKLYEKFINYLELRIEEVKISMELTKEFYTKMRI